MTLTFFLTLFIAFIVSHGALTEAEQEQLLDMHNDARSSAAQGTMTCSGGNCPAGTITRLKWSATVAASAQAYAEELASTCGTDHSGTSYGENLAWSFSSSTSGLRTPYATCYPWIGDESPLFTYGSTNNNFGSIGHFTQVVADKTRYVGCGCADSPSLCYYQWFGKSYYSRNCVCQYSPGGNCVGCNPDTVAFPYTSVSGGCQNSNCDSGYTCDSSGLCDDNGGNGLGTVEPTGPTPGPVPSPTPGPVDLASQPTSNTGSNPSSVVISGAPYPDLNGRAMSASTIADSTLPKYGSFSAYGYTFVFWYCDNCNGGSWFLADESWIPNWHYFSYCECDGCAVTECGNWLGNVNGFSVTNVAAYSSSSSSDKDKNELIEGLLIGLGIAVGVFVLSLLIYWCVKRNSSKKSQFTVVEMNNEISNHEYVNMEN